MNDLISRQAVLEIIQSLYPAMPRVPWIQKNWQKRYEPYIRTENAIKELPSAQPEDKCGECDAWNQYKNYPRPTIDVAPVRHAKLLNAHPYGECSNCGYLIDIREKFNYCPNCGARMDKK